MPFKYTSIADNHNTKKTPFNTRLEELDGLFGGVLTIDVDSSNNYTVPEKDFYQNCIFKVVDDAGANGTIKITVPSRERPVFVVRNDSSQNVSVITEGQSATRTIGAGGCSYYYYYEGKVIKTTDSNLQVFVSSVTETTLTSPATSVNADYPPSVASGDLIIILACTLNGSSITTPTGYKLLAEGKPSTSSSSNSRVAAFVKEASGAEGGTSETLTVTGAATVWAVQVIRIIGGVGGVNGVFASGGESAISVTVDPPELSIDNPFTETLWVAAGGNIDDAGSVVSAPTNYSLLANTLADAGVDSSAAVFTATRNLNNNVENPEVFTLSESEGNFGITIGVVGMLDSAIVILMRKAAVLGGSNNGASVSLVRSAAVLGGSNNGASVSLVRLAAVI